MSKLIDEEIEHVLRTMSSLPVASDDYKRATEILETLYRAKGVKDPNSLSKESIVAVAANIIGLLLVLNFERLGVVTSKAFSLIMRLR